MARRRSIALAFVASLLLHLVLLLLMWDVDLTGSLQPREPRAEDVADDVVEFVLIDDLPLPADSPDAYVSVPERHAVEAPPAEPDFLALHDSRAADLLDGGDAGSGPGAERQAEFKARYGK